MDTTKNPASASVESAITGYALIATDCEIIRDKIESLRNALREDGSETAARIERHLWRARWAIEEAVLAC